MTKLENIKLDIVRNGKVVERKGLYIDTGLQKNLDEVKDTIKDDWDFVFAVDGIEGGGKSVFAQQIARYLDPNFTVDNIAFTPDEFKQKITKATRYSAVVYDEAFGGLNSKQALTEKNVTIVSMLTEIRQKNLFVFIVLPSFFELVRNVALWRTRGLFHIEAPNYQRGYFKYYNYETKKYLYLKGLKLYDYRCVNKNLWGRFYEGYAVDGLKYVELKRKSLKEYGKEMEEKGTKEGQLKNKMINMLGELYYNNKVKREDLIQAAGISMRQLHYLLAKYREIKPNMIPHGVGFNNATVHKPVIPSKKIEDNLLIDEEEGEE